MNYKFSFDIIKYKYKGIWALFTLKIFQKMRMSEKCRNNNSDNPLTSRRTDGGKNEFFKMSSFINCITLTFPCIIPRIFFLCSRPNKILCSRRIVFYIWRPRSFGGDSLPIVLVTREWILLLTPDGWFRSTLILCLLAHSPPLRSIPLLALPCLLDPLRPIRLNITLGDLLLLAFERTGVRGWK